MNKTDTSTQESQLNRVFEWVSDSAPVHRRKCTVEPQLLSCAPSGPKKNIIDKESQLMGIKKTKPTMSDIHPDEPNTDYTENPIPNFLDVNYTRERRSEGQSYMLDRFHPLAGGDPQSHIGNDRNPGDWSRNDARDNFKCPMYSK